MISYRARRLLRKSVLPLLFLVLMFAVGMGVYISFSGITGSVVRETSDASPSVANNTLFSDPYDLTVYSPVAVEVFAEGVLLKNNCTGVFIAMPYEKTFSIKRGLDHRLDIRPTQHDLMEDILDAYTINVTYARIERVNNDFYYATLLLENDDVVLQLDTRPSDALAVAARVSAPVYISDRLLRQKGINLCDRDGTT